MQLFHEESPIHYHISARDFDRAGGSQFRVGKDYALDELDKLMPLIGMGMTPSVARQIMNGQYDFAMDAIQQPVTTAQLAFPVQFLQNWLPGVVEIVTAKRSIDGLVGRSTVGAWEDEQIVQTVIEMTGGPLPYGDTTNTPLTDWNPNFVYRSVVNFEEGMRVGVKEEARTARIGQGINSGEIKRRSVAIQLEIARNAIGFYGYNSGANLTYGFLNDPNLPAYVAVPTLNWSTATFAQIQNGLLTALSALRTQSAGLITPNKDPITLAISTNRIDQLAKSNDLGTSVYNWLTQFYPNVRVVDAVQLNAANGGANVFYLYADKVQDSGTDDQSTFIQVVPSVFQLIGMQKLTKGYEEAYSNATAGVMLKRPYAVVRYTGI